MFSLAHIHTHRHTHTRTHTQLGLQCELRRDRGPVGVCGVFPDKGGTVNCYACKGIQESWMEHLNRNWTQHIVTDLCRSHRYRGGLRDTLQPHFWFSGCGESVWTPDGFPGLILTPFHGLIPLDLVLRSTYRLRPPPERDIHIHTVGTNWWNWCSIGCLEFWSFPSFDLTETRLVIVNSGCSWFLFICNIG